MQPPTAFILSNVVLGCSYFVAITTAFLAKSCLFQLDAVYIPMLLSSAAGLLNLIVDLGIYTWVQLNTNVITSLVLAMISVLCWTVLSLLAFRRIHIVRKMDEMQSPSPRPRTLTTPENEIQRQHLMKLLQSPENIRTETSSSSPEATYKITWPGASGGHTRNNTMGTIKGRFHSRNGSSQLYPSPQRPTSSYRFDTPSPRVLCEAPTGTPRMAAAGFGIPTLIPEESTMQTTSTNPDSAASILPSIPPLRTFHRRGNSTFSTLTAGERVPSYHCPSSWYSQSTAPPLDHAPPLPNMPPIGENGYPIEKPRVRESQVQTPEPQPPKRNLMDNYTVIEDTAAVKRQLELSRGDSPPR